MKKLIAFIFILISFRGISQIVDLKGDSIRVFKTGGHAEFVLRNATKDTLGFLYNKGNGITEFRTIPAVITANNGITLAASNLQLGGALTGNTLITNGANSLTFSSTTASGLFFNRQINGSSTSVNALNLVANSTSGNTFSDGFGAFLEWENKGINGVFRNVAGIDGVRDVNDSSGRLRFYVFKDGDGGSKVMELSRDGQAKLNNYIGSTFYGTLAHRLGVDASGNLIQDTTTLATVAGSTLQTVLTAGNVATKSAYVDSLIANNGNFNRSANIGSGAYASSLGTLIYSYGNSITAGTAASVVANDYVSIVDNSYGVTGSNIHNLGIGGSVLDTFFTLSVPTYTSSIRYITMMWGTNEAALGWDTGRYHTTYKRAIDSIKSKGYPVSKIVLIQTIPAPSYSSLINFAYVDSLVALQEGVRFVPMYYYSLTNNLSKYIADGIHPNNSGHNLMANRIIASLNDSDVTGLDRVLNVVSSPFINAGVISVNSISTVNDMLVQGMTISNKGDASSVYYGTGTGRTGTTGISNTGIGSGTLQANTTGNQNTAVGQAAMYNNTAGSNNTALGQFSLIVNTTGNNNVAVGQSAMYNNSSGSNNVAVGLGSLYTNTTGFSNTALGQGALNINTTGYQNTAVGQNALLGNTTGLNNTALGQGAMTINLTGSNNTASGAGALYGNTTGGNNTATGQAALFTNTTGSNNAAFGYGAMTSNTTASQNTATGQGAMSSNTTGSNNTAIGELALAANVTGSGNTAIGQQALYNNTVDNNTAVGRQALLANTSGNNNTALGQASLAANTTGFYNTASGQGSLTSNTTGYYNTANGINALQLNTTGQQNTAMGLQALGSNTTSIGSTAIGFQTLLSSTGASNTAIGQYALKNNTTGANNTAIGYNTMLPVAYSNSANIAGIFITTRNDHDSVAGTTNLVGVNTIAPSFTLDVNGRSRTSNQARFDSSLKVAIFPSGATTDSFMVWRPSDSTVRKIPLSSLSSLYEVPLTFSTGLTRTTNTITNNLSTGVATGQKVVGGTAANDTLSLYGNSATSSNTSTNAAINLRVSDAKTLAMTVLNNGNVGIGTSAPGNALAVNGNVQALANTVNVGFFANDAVNSGNQIFSITRQNSPSDPITTITNYGAFAVSVNHSSPSNVFSLFINSSGSVGIGNSAPNSTLQVSGSAAFAYVAKTSNYTLTANDYFVNCTANTFTITVPASVAGRVYKIKNSGAGVITISGVNIDGVASKTLNTQYSGLEITGDGSTYAVTGTF